MSHPVDYPVALAVEDFVPVVLTALAAARLVAPAARTGRGARRAAVCGAVLIASGGLSKAVWKLVVALEGPDVQPLNKALFPLLSAGFLLFALALPRVGRVAQVPPGRDLPDGSRAASSGRTRLAWVFAAVWAVTCALSLGVRSTVPVMTLTVAAVTVCAVRMILLAREAGDTPAAAAAGCWLLGMYVLGPLAARPDQSVALQWVEQSCNTLTQAAAVLAACRLTAALDRDGHPASRTRTSGAPEPTPPPATADDRTVTP